MTEQDAINAAVDAARVLEDFCRKHKKLDRKSHYEVDFACDCPFCVANGRCLMQVHLPENWCIDDEMYFVGGGAWGDAKEKNLTYGDVRLPQ